MEKTEDYGTNADGSPNYDYCTHCYQKGEFTDKTEDVEEFAERMLEAVKDDPNVPEMSQDEAVAMLQNLGRWKKE